MNARGRTARDASSDRLMPPGDPSRKWQVHAFALPDAQHPCITVAECNADSSPTETSRCQHHRIALKSASDTKDSWHPGGLVPGKQSAVAGFATGKIRATICHCKSTRCSHALSSASEKSIQSTAHARPVEHPPKKGDRRRRDVPTLAQMAGKAQSRPVICPWNCWQRGNTACANAWHWTETGSSQSRPVRASTFANSPSAHMPGFRRPCVHGRLPLSPRVVAHHR